MSKLTSASAKAFMHDPLVWCIEQCSQEKYREACPANYRLHDTKRILETMPIPRPSFCALSASIIQAKAFVLGHRTKHLYQARDNFRVGAVV